MPPTRTRRRGEAAITKLNQRLERLQVEYVPALSISPNAYNPNRQSAHDFELLIRSMWEDGFTQPILALSDSRKIVDGEHRWTAAIVLNHLVGSGVNIDDATEKGINAVRQEIQQARDNLSTIVQDMEDNGYELEVPVIFTTMHEVQARISTLRHNRARGSEEMELTAQIVREMEAAGFGGWVQDSLLMDDIEMQRILQDLSAADGLAGDTFSDAWEPSDQTESKEIKNIEHNMSPAAALAVREQERKLAQARTDDERQAARADTDVHRVSLVFTGPEATIVRNVLGAQPAKKLLEMCQQFNEEPTAP